MNKIEFIDVWFKYPGSKDFVLQNFSWNYTKCHAIGILGVNGSGKTTLMKLIAGILKPSLGEVRINDKIIKNINSTKEIVSIVPENAKLFIVGPTIRKDLLRIINDNEHVNSLLEKNGFGSLADRRIYHLSEGQRRMLAIFISFQLSKQILIYDEPTIGLDSNGRRLFLDLIKNATQEEKTVLISTNDPRILPELDHLLVIQSGSLYMEGIPNEILYRLENETELIPNQIVRVLAEIRKKNKKIPLVSSLSELNKFISLRD